MAVYMAERHLPGIMRQDLEAAQSAAIATSQRFTAQGRPVRYLRSIWLPGEAHVMSLFEAENPRVVRDVNEAAGIPFTRIVEAFELAP